MFAIDKNVPLPEGAGARGRIAIYPFRAMQVGDSFAVPKSEAGKVRNACGIWGQRINGKFSSRTQPDGSLRVWRIA
jgi:hypothetical protein